MERKKKAWVAVFIYDKVDFKTKGIVRDEEGHYVMIKGTIQQEDTTLVHFYAPNIRAPKYVKQILMDIKGEIDRNTDIIGDINTPMTSVYRFSRQKRTLHNGKGNNPTRGITLVNSDAPNIGALKYVKHILMDITGYFDSNINIVGYF